MATRRVPTLDSGGKLLKAVLPLPLLPADAGADPAGAADDAQAAAIAAAATDASGKASAAQAAAVSAATATASSDASTKAAAAQAAAVAAAKTYTDTAVASIEIPEVSTALVETFATAPLPAAGMSLTSPPYLAFLTDRPSQRRAAITVHTDSDVPYTLSAQVSADAATWTEVYTEVAKESRGFQLSHQVPTAGADRYVRVKITTADVMSTLTGSLELT